MLADLKQFIAATVGQHIGRLEVKIDNLEHRFDNLEAQVNEMHQTIQDHVITYISTVDDQVQEHETKLKILTPQAK